MNHHVIINLNRRALRDVAEENKPNADSIGFLRFDSIGVAGDLRRPADDPVVIKWRGEQLPVPAVHHQSIRGHLQDPAANKAAAFNAGVSNLFCAGNLLGGRAHRAAR